MCEKTAQVVGGAVGHPGCHRGYLFSIGIQWGNRVKWRRKPLTMLAQVQCHRLFAIYRALLTHSSLPILSSQSGVRGAVEHSRKGRRVQDSRFYRAYRNLRVTAVTCESYVRRLPQVSRRYSEETAGLASVTQIRARGLWRGYSRLWTNCKQ